MLQQVINLLQNNKLSEAKNLCEQLNRKNKKSLETWMLLADIYQQTGAIDKAINTYRKTIKLKPAHIAAHTNLAMLYHSQGKYAKAEPCYRQSLRLDPNQATIHYNLAVVLQELDKFDDAAVHYQQAITIKPDYVKAYANLGFIQRHIGKSTDAISSYQKALHLAPDIAEIYYNLGLSFLDSGDTINATQNLQKALKLNSSYADAWAGLGSVEFFSNNPEKAEEHYVMALNLQSDNVDILCGYNNVLTSMGKNELAMEYANKALSLEPDNIQVLITKSTTLLILGQLDDAIVCCEQILKKHKNHEGAICLAASIYEKKGDIDRAYKYLTPLLKTQPSVKVITNFASISKSLGLVKEAIQYMETLLEKNISMPVTLQSKLHFSLGKAYDGQKNYEPAFKNFYAANNLKKSTFDITSMRNNIDAQIAIFSSDFAQNLSESGNLSSRPIFIVGMPRSGTTLMEQIISSHHNVAAAGELTTINTLAVSIPQTNNSNNSNNYYVNFINQITTEQLNKLAEKYLKHISSINPDAQHITDKMPSNFMHLGFIQLLFPKARIIHCMRNPLDTCLSCYFQDFARPHPWIYDLHDIGTVHLEYQRIMNHWKNVLNIPMLEIQYESLVENQEEVSRKIIEFCDLDWDDNCMQFHKNKRFVKTASYDQVRQPMYKKSVARWKNYKEQIKPLLNTFKHIN